MKKIKKRKITAHREKKTFPLSMDVSWLLLGRKNRAGDFFGDTHPTYFDVLPSDVVQTLIRFVSLRKCSSCTLRWVFEEDEASSYALCRVCTQEALTCQANLRASRLRVKLQDARAEVHGLTRNLNATRGELFTSRRAQQDCQEQLQVLQRQDLELVKLDNRYTVICHACDRPVYCAYCRCSKK